MSRKRQPKSEAVQLAVHETLQTVIRGVTSIATHPVAMGVFGFWLVDRLGGAYISYVDVIEYIQELRSRGYIVNTPPVPESGVTMGAEQMAVWVAKLRQMNPGYSFPEPRILKRWNPRAGLLSSGSQMAAQAGLTAYLGAEALKGAAELVEAIKP